VSPAPGTLLVISQVYPPDPAAVGQHVASAAEEMARRGWRVVVYCADRGYEDSTLKYPKTEIRNGVQVSRLPFSSFGKTSIARRLLAQTLFMIQAVARSIFTNDVRLVLTSTSPPFAGFGGAVISWIRRAPFVWWIMDLNPDQMIAAGRIGQDSIAANVFRWLNRVAAHRAESIVVLDRFMERRVLAAMPMARSLHIIPPWPHDDATTRAAAEPNSFRRAHGLERAFVVMYSGNHALQHPLTTLLEAAEAMEAHADLVFVFIGAGAGKAEVDKRIGEGRSNLRSFPFQPFESVGDSLAAADVHVVSMGNEVVGIVHPCKVYGAMAVGRPILFMGPALSHAGEIVDAHQCGRTVQHGDVASTIAELESLIAMPRAQRERLGDNAVHAIATEFPRQRLRGMFCDCLEAVARRRSV